jgi:hypothetical protein
MPMDRCRNQKLIDNLHMKALRLEWAVTLLSTGLRKGRELYCPAQYCDR